MKDLERRAEELCASPTGCVFLLLAEAGKLQPGTAADPAVAVQVAAQAVGETIFFRTDHDWVVPAALAEGPRLLPFAREILAHRAARWWFAPLSRATQEWIGQIGSEPNWDGVAELNSPPSAGELYGQEALSGMITSTGVGVMSSALAAILYHSGDYEEGDAPLARYQLRASPELRIFEIDDPGDWHDLCVRYPARGQNDRLVPDWNTFAEHWDAAHLCLGGLLTADQVRVESEAGWTLLELWEFEHTRWLRWRFEDIERLPDIVDLLDASLWLPDPPALALPPGVGNRVALTPLN